MSRYRFELATEADDADLLRILAETPMAGRIAVSFRRQPSYFAAAAVDGRFRQVITCRDTENGRLVGFGTRSIREVYVNGKLQPVGYLSNLRLVEEHRNRGLIARGYRFFRQQHADGRCALYLTTIAEGNEVALKLLTSGRAGLPSYHFAGNYRTAAIPLGLAATRRGAGPHASANSGLTIRSATCGDLPALLQFLQSEGPRRQFFPQYHEEDFFRPGGAFEDLKREDLLLAFRGERLVGTLAGWDQQRFRQTVIESYRGPLRWLRPVYNGWARLRGQPGLPPPGSEFRYRTASLPVVAGDDPEVFCRLIDHLLERAAAADPQYLLVGLHERDPLLGVLADFRVTTYTTRLYLVCWDDGEALRKQLDDRVPYLELGCL